MKTYLHVGGCVAAGFDATGDYLLTISHDGRGVFSTKTWRRVARDYNLAYSEDGVGIGIGPLDGQAIMVTQIDYATGILSLASPNGKFRLKYAEGVFDVIENG